MVDYTSSTESFYSGASSSLDPEGENFSGYRMNVGDVGQSLNPQSANQVMEVVGGIKQGLRSMEVGALDVQTFETIPKQQFKEINALARLTGVRPTLHAPVVDPSGWGQQGQNEEQRISTERQFMDVIDKAKTMDVKGNIPVVFHAANGTPGKLWIKEGDKEVLKTDVAVDRETGQATPMKMEYKFRPEHPDLLKDEKGAWGEGKLFKVEDQLESINNTQWENELTKIAQFTKATDEVMGSSPAFFAGKEDWRIQQKIDSNGMATGDAKVIDKNGKEVELDEASAAYYSQDLKRADLFLKDAELGFVGAFGKAFKYANDEKQKEALYKLSEDYSVKLKSIVTIDKKKGIVEHPLSETLDKRKLIEDAFGKLQELTSREHGYDAPKLFETSENFAREKASETFSNVALHGYKQYGKDAPVVAIENWSPGTGFASPEEMGKLIDESRDKFAEKLSDDKGISKKNAAKIAEKHIGVTWDVGHLNMYKQYGYNDKELAEMTKKIAPKVKHLHLTDNFGFADSHLVPGMGNVPFKEHMEALEKAGDLKGMSKVIEAGGFISQISKKGAYADTLSAFGSPIYGAKNQAAWQGGMSGNYSAGYGMSNPGIHHGMYGSGFTTLPMELGGTVPGGGSRLSGNAMA